MTTEEKQITIRKIIMEQLQVNEDEVTPGSNFTDDLGADSLDVVELVMNFEEAFDIMIKDEDAEKLTTVQAVYDYIAKHTK